LESGFNLPFSLSITNSPKSSIGLLKGYPKQFFQTMDKLNQVLKWLDPEYIKGNMLLKKSPVKVV
jgi:hypothetical protein